MAHELRQLVDTANAPIFGIGKYCTTDPEKFAWDNQRPGKMGAGSATGTMPTSPGNCLLPLAPFLGVLLCFTSIQFRA